MQNLSDTQRHLIIQVARLQGIQVRRNEDTRSDFWEFSSDGVHWFGQDRLAKDEEHYWQRIAGYLTQWGINGDATHELWLELPDALSDALTQEHIVAIKAGDTKYDWKRRITETWIQWKQGESHATTS